MNGIDHHQQTDGFPVHFAHLVGAFADPRTKRHGFHRSAASAPVIWRAVSGLTMVFLLQKQVDARYQGFGRARHDAYETSRLLRIKRTKRYGFRGSVDRLYG